MGRQYRRSERYTVYVQRGAYVGRAQPGPFHCLSCKTYVTGTESGHCPRCGFVPPSTVVVHDEPRDEASHRRARATALAMVVLILALVLILLK